MLFQVKTSISGFFEKNLFERIIIYLFLSEFVTRFIFELAMGQSGLLQSQHKQWIFYGLLALDYVLSLKKIMNIRFTVNPFSLFSLFIFIMILQGLFIGIMNHNSAFVIMNDTVPLLMIALNILRMQSRAEYTKPIDFRSLFYITTLLAFGACMFGYTASLLGKPSSATIAFAPIYFPMFLAALFSLRPFPKNMAVLFIIMFVLSISEINRTSMAFSGLVIMIYVLLQVIKNPSKGILLLVITAILGAASWVILPKDSKTYRRIVGITELDLSSRTGSIGERAAEFDSINATLKRKGTTSEWFGLGFGGLYEFQSTHSYVKNYGHAHYSWAWFKLRFGYVGYAYLAVLSLMLLYNCIQGFRARTNTGIFVALLCLQGILYLVTYVNAVFLCSGIHFLLVQQENEDIP